VLAYGLFVPIFFTNIISLSVDARTLQPGMLWFTFVIIVTAFVGKWLGAGIGARWGGLSFRHRRQPGR
jgi:Kef-type K+ transport system membrane component KefB